MYLYISYKFYIYNLKKDFYKLKDICKWDMLNYEIEYISEINKKYIPKYKDIINKINIFNNENSIGFLLNKKYIVVDFDKSDNNINELIRNKMPYTVCEKTPNGYHYYIENDLNIIIKTYVKLVINNKITNIDILGKGQIVTCTPTIINNKQYYWINNPFENKFAKLSDNKWIVDLTKNTKPFVINYLHNLNKINYFKNIFIIINDINIEEIFRNNLQNSDLYDKKFKFLDGWIYNYNNNYIFFTNLSFKKYNNKKELFNKLKNLIKKLNIYAIYDLSIVYTQYLNDNVIIKFNKCQIDDNYIEYKNNNYFKSYIETKNVLSNTFEIINNNIIITNIYDDDFLLNINKNNIYGSESIYLTILLSNELNISCSCITISYNIKDNKINEPNKIKIIKNKLFNYFIYQF